jgi:hypothetical protein
MSDKSIEFLDSVKSEFEAIGINIGYFSPTQTGLNKSIFDAHEKLCEFFKTVQIHDFMSQGKGTAAKRLIEVSVISNGDEKKLTVSLYRPDTKQGDPRFWISGIKNYVMPDDLLIFILLNQKLYLINCCDPNFFHNGHITNYLLQVIKQKMNKTIKGNSTNVSVDLLPSCRTKVMEQSPLISENSGYETIQIYR